MNLLLPYANDIDGNLIHVKDSHKGQKYSCPNCGAELSLKIGKVRRTHFAHKIKTGYENRCSESVLHRQFKEKCSEFISAKIKESQELFFAWKCERCRQPQKDNLLRDVVEVVTEYNLGVCRPDIALLDKEGMVLMAVEIVYSHSPAEKSLKYYEENNIACLKVKVSCFEDCDEIEKVLINPQKVEIYPKRKCEECCNEVAGAIDKTNSNRSAGGAKKVEGLKESLENALKARENEILCKGCGGKMKVLETEFGTHLLVCKSYPKCKSYRTVDILLWPDKFQ